MPVPAAARGSPRPRSADRPWSAHRPTLLATLALAAHLLATVALGACSRPVDVALPVYADDPACRALAPLWPGTVSGLPSRAVGVESPAARAWGDPPVVAICGTEPLGPTEHPCLVVDGVDWVVLPASDGVRFATYGRSPALDVFVPGRYSPEGALLPAFGPAARALPQNGHRCT